MSVGSLYQQTCIKICSGSCSIQNHGILRRPFRSFLPVSIRMCKTGLQFHVNIIGSTTTITTTKPEGNAQLSKIEHFLTLGFFRSLICKSPYVDLQSIQHFPKVLHHRALLFTHSRNTLVSRSVYWLTKNSVNKDV